VKGGLDICVLVAAEGITKFAAGEGDLDAIQHLELGWIGSRGTVGNQGVVGKRLILEGEPDVPLVQIVTNLPARFHHPVLEVANRLQGRSQLLRIKAPSFNIQERESGLLIVHVPNGAQMVDII
jgi:hypothetical protein